MIDEPTNKPPIYAVFRTVEQYPAPLDYGELLGVTQSLEVAREMCTQSHHYHFIVRMKPDVRYQPNTAWDLADVEFPHKEKHLHEDLKGA